MGQIDDAVRSMPGLKGLRATVAATGEFNTAKADAGVRPGESVQHVVMGTQRATMFVVVLTTERVCVLPGRRSPRWVERSAVTRASGRSTLLRGECLDIDFDEGEPIRLFEAAPKGVAAALAQTLRNRPIGSRMESVNVGRLSGLNKSPAPERTAPKPAEVTPVLGGAFGESRGTFLGGEFIGNLARRASTRYPPFTPQAGVYLKMTSDGRLLISLTSHSAPRASYRLDDPALIVDTADKIGRSLKSGHLAGTALATLLLGPVGLVGLTVSTQRTVKQATVLAVQDGEDYGVFAISKAEVGHRLAAAQATVQPRATGITAGAPPSPPTGEADDEAATNADVSDAQRTSDLELLSQLGELHKAGVLTEEEFTNKKKEILRRL